MRFFTAFCVLLMGLAEAVADPVAAVTGVAVGSLGRNGLPAATQYVLRSTVFEQLRSRGVPTMEISTAPYIYLARVGIDNVDKGCIYRVIAELVPNSSEPAVSRPSLWTREFTSKPIACDEVSEQMTKTLDGFAVQFSRDSASGLLRDGGPVSAKK